MKAFNLFSKTMNTLRAPVCLMSPTLTLLSGDVWLVPELGGVLDELDVHLNVWITICLDQRDKDEMSWRGHRHSERRTAMSCVFVSPYMDFETSGSACAPERFGVLPPLAGSRFLLSVLSASPLDMCRFSGSCGETGKAGSEGVGALPWREAAPSSSGVPWPLDGERCPIRGLGGTPATAAVLGLRPIRGLEGKPAGGGCLACKGLA